MKTAKTNAQFVLTTNLKHNFGPLVMDALNNPSIIEIMLNPDGRLWVEPLGQPMECVGLIEPEQAQAIIQLMASGLKTTVTVENPIVEGELPFDGSRFEGLIPPVTANPCFAIRKKAPVVFSLGDYLENRILPPLLKKNAGESSKAGLTDKNFEPEFSSLDFLRNALAARRNILVVGGTGSGKTTFVNALGLTLSDAAPHDRLIVIEDTLEIQSKSANVVFLRTSDFVDIRRLVRASMRLRPDRILIGEVRDGGALDLLKAWNTGHPGGIATIHANSAHEGLLRLEELIEEATPAPKHKLIGTAIDLLVFIEKYRDKRKISEIAEVKGYDRRAREYQLEYCLNRDLAFGRAA